MAESNNFSEINDNFDTIKTLLNSIRAQGILNTSDVDKLLEGINSKLEKINTEEDIDLIKAFLSELKKNLDERHEVLISKFGAIESLFSNLLKNSTDAVKKPELQELFDIVATNLSVFSREVVSQKETLTDITLRLDAMRSDDTQKKEIIKSVSVVRNDIEKVNNGFDSIVISLNENFKTVLKTISEVDQSEAIKGFTEQIDDILTSTNTILSAIQLVDKKNDGFEHAIEGLATQDDTMSIKKSVIDLSEKSQELINLVDLLTQKSYKIDTLADKIDASVNIIAGLKSEIAEKDDGVKNALLDRLMELESVVKTVSDNQGFEEFKKSLKDALLDIANGSEQLRGSINSAFDKISKLNSDLQALDVNTGFKNISDGMEKIGEGIKEKFASETDKLSQLMEVNVTRTIQEVASNADVLNTRLKESHTVLSGLCEKSFEEVSGGLSDLKAVIAQLDENNVSANNAIFSNITDRLAIFENSLKTSLEKQEDYISGSSSNVFEQITNIKNITDGIDYKLDSNAIEIGNSKKEYKQLAESVNKVLAIDFVEIVKNFKAELFVVKEDLSAAVETVQTELSENITKDLFGKYELLVSRLDSVEDQLKYAQNEAMRSLDEVLSKISASIVDILSYVSTSKEASTLEFDEKLKETVRYIQDSNLNYIDSVRDVVDAIKEHIEEKLMIMNKESEGRLEKITSSVADVRKSMQQDLQTAYDKLAEIKGDVISLNETIKDDRKNISDDVSKIMLSADNLKEAFDEKMELLKKSLLETVSDFKTDFTCENADNISELKFNAETLNKRSYEQAVDLKNQLKAEIAGIIETLKLNIMGLTEMVSSTSLKIEGANKEVIDFVKHDFTSEVNNSVDSIKTNTADVLSEIENKVTEVVNGFGKIENSVNNLSKDTTTSLTGTLAKILENFTALNAALDESSEKSAELLKENSEELKKDFYELKRKVADMDNQIDEDLAHQISIIEGSFESINLMLVDVMNQTTETLGDRIKKELNGASAQMTQALSEELEQYKVQIADLFEGLQGKNNEQAEYIKDCTMGLRKILEETLEEHGKNSVLQLEDIGNHLKGMIHENVEVTSADYNDLKIKLNEFTERVERQNNVLVDTIKAQLDDVVKFVDSNIDIQAQEVNSAFEELSSGMQKVVATVTDFNSELTPKMEQQSQEIKSEIDVLSSDMQKVISTVEDFNSELSPKIEAQSQEVNTIFERISSSIQKVISTVEDFNSGLTPKMEQQSLEIKSEFDVLSSDMQKVISTIEDFNSELSPKIEAQSQEVNTVFERISSGIQKVVSTITDFSTELNPKISDIQTVIRENGEKSDTNTSDIKAKLQTIVDEELKPNFDNINEKIRIFFEENMLTFVTQYTNSNSKLSEDISAGLSEFKDELLSISDRLDKDELTRLNIQQANLKEMQEYFNKIADEIKQNVKNDIMSSADLLNTASAEGYEKIGQTLEEKVTALQIQIDNVKQNSNVCRDIITKLVQEHSELISGEIANETDVLVKELLESIDLLKTTQKDDISMLTTALENSISGYVVDAVNDLKSYVDIRVDNSTLDGKLDSLRTDLAKIIDDTTDNISKLLKASVFTDAIKDLRATNEILLKSMTEKLTEQLQVFIKANVSDKMVEKFNLLDKKFIDTIVDNYEEVKMLSVQYNKSLEQISGSVSELVNRFTDSKDEINNNLKTLVGGINKSVDELKLSFADLKAQIMNKSFDEAFHTSIKNQIKGIEDLVNEQLGYMEDLNGICGSSLPEVMELNALVKHNISQSLDEISAKIETQDNTVKSLTGNLSDLKSDIITQFIDIFNQISFVTEQEEILDFIQEKHSELITILSHIVTTTGDIQEVKDNVELVDSKIDVLKEDIDLINEKLTSIMSSDGDIDYVYSFQDLESDIANLRIVLNEMKEDNKSKEFEELIQSTNNIYQIVETIKSEMPKFEAEEFKKDFNNLAEDIVSISTRTNKLILTSDESYKVLQDNLQDFKLVIDDLDERTRNFAHESGIEKLDYKLAAINSMIKNGAQTNQVFNQVFEYLAEWVDKAGEQLATISDKVDTLDDINQIRVMLEDLRAEAQDDTESAELVSALEAVFEKQAKRISSLEAKLDKIIVASNVNNKKSKSEAKPIEDALNKFLSEIEGKFVSQQDKISALETKLEEVVSLVDNKDTAQLTKKVGGMDKQLAKLNKSIEKIASNVVKK